MPIENRNLKAGTRLVAKYKKQTYSCMVTEGEGGKLRYRLEDGREFKSPSAAGMAITGHACDGWVFWSVETAQTAPEMQQTEIRQQPEVVEQETSAETKSSDTASKGSAEDQQVNIDKKSVCRKVGNQKGVPEGQVRWHCYACRNSFMLPVGQTPKGCPGHPVN